MQVIQGYGKKALDTEVFEILVPIYLSHLISHLVPSC